VERKRATDFAQGLWDLFDHYVHGEISRRKFLDGAKKFAAGGLTAAALWEILRPNYALAQQVPPDDKRLNTERATVPSPQGNGSIRGYYVRPANAQEKLPGVLVIHENRGLNPYIEDVARRLGTANFLAFAPDGLTSLGGYPGDDEKGAELFRTVDQNKMFEDFVVSTTTRRHVTMRQQPSWLGNGRWIFSISTCGLSDDASLQPHEDLRPTFVACA